ncbi:MAG: HAMP domain-containing histidine kinase, partial [Anaerolineae bacterium]|nr:HAMP domain-containing histidine kinase [Anaerolineae bacterium]
SKALELLNTLEVSADQQTRLMEIKQLLEQQQDAQQKLDETIKEHGQFISFIVHEIRKPMTTIRGYSDMLVKKVVGDLNAMQDQFINTIRNNVISMDNLLSDISDLTKMTTGRMQPEPKMDLFKNIGMKLEKEFTEKAEARQVKLTFDIPQGLPMLNLDSGRVERALSKLIDNAIKYTPEGQGEVVVSAASDNGKLRVTVKDNGIGISESDQQHLGELFFRGDHEQVLQTKGYGMGIPIVVECMKMVDGELSWESKEGEGASFSLLLPAMGG